MSPLVAFALAFSTSAPTMTCRVDLRGDTVLVAALRSRVELGSVPRTLCTDLTIVANQIDDAIEVVIETGKERTVRRLESLSLAAALIESWAYAPAEARIPTDIANRPLVPADGRRKAYRSMLTIKEDVELVRQGPRGPDVRVLAAGEVGVGFNGDLWYGPTVGGFLMDGKWTAGGFVRLARHDGASNMTSWFFEATSMIGRDYRVGIVAFEPRVGFGLRRTQLTGAPTSADTGPCRAFACRPVVNSQAPTNNNAGWTQIVLSFRTAAVVALTDRFDLWAAVDAAAPLAGRKDAGDLTLPEHPNIATVQTRFSVGGRFRL